MTDAIDHPFQRRKVKIKHECSYCGGYTEEVFAKTHKDRDSTHYGMYFSVPVDKLTRMVCNRCVVKLLDKNLAEKA